MPKPVSHTCPVADIHDHVGRLDVLVNQPTSVEPAKCGGQSYCESQKLPDLHRFADEAIEGLAAWYSTTSIVRPRSRTNSKGRNAHAASRQVLEFVFVRQSIDALERRIARRPKRRR